MEAKYLQNILHLRKLMQHSKLIQSNIHVIFKAAMKLNDEALNKTNEEI